MSDAGHHPGIDDLATCVLLDAADDAQRAELARLLASSCGNRRRFLEHAALHGMLAREAASGLLDERPRDVSQTIVTAAATGSRRPAAYWLAAAAAITVCLAVVTLLPTNAGAALDRAVVEMREVQDRTYIIDVIDPGQGVASRGDRGRFPPSNYLDGATLWLRGPGEFVLRQSLPNGQIRVIGADGTGSWSLRGDGPVRASADPSRFGRAIFTRNGEIAFLDLRTQLDELKRSYRIEWLERKPREIWKLRGFRHARDQGGPCEIELWIDSDGGQLVRMILRQLPRGDGAPRSIVIRLESTTPLSPDFFRHTAHHEPGRTVLVEP